MNVDKPDQERESSRQAQRASKRENTHCRAKMKFSMVGKGGACVCVCVCVCVFVFVSP